MESSVVPQTGRSAIGPFGSPCIFVRESPRFLALIPSTIATAIEATPTPTIDQPTTRRVVEVSGGGGGGGGATTTGGATTGGGGGGAGTTTGFTSVLGGGGATWAAALRRSSMSFSIAMILRSTSSLLRASGERCR